MILLFLKVFTDIYLVNNLQIQENQLILGDCLTVHPHIISKSIDLIITDLPYGQTQNKWDEVISSDSLWKEYKRIIKDNGVIILFGQGLFTAHMMMTNTKMWRYNLIWEKDRPSGFLNANRMPLRSHEDIMVFYKRLPTYNPQFVKGKPYHSMGTKFREDVHQNNNYGNFTRSGHTNLPSENKHPRSVIYFPRPHPPLHPTQKPVELYEYLIKTFTNKDELVLDSTMGVGTVALAAMNTKRKYIGIEENEEYYIIAQKQVKERLTNPRLFDFHA